MALEFWLAAKQTGNRKKARWLLWALILIGMALFLCLSRGGWLEAMAGSFVLLLLRLAQVYDKPWRLHFAPTNDMWYVQDTIDVFRTDLGSNSRTTIRMDMLCPSASDSDDFSFPDSRFARKSGKSILAPTSRRTRYGTTTTTGSTATTATATVDVGVRGIHLYS
jgi:hypothetical protein